MNLPANPRVLVVEDNATTAKSIVLFLENFGMSTVIAPTGRQGLDIIARGGIDLVLLDLNLPDMDGLQVCETVRANYDCPLIMLTARSSENDIVTGLDLGAQDYLCKPFGSRELIARIRRVLRDSRDETTSPVLTHEDLVLDQEHRTLAQADVKIKLTKSEFDLLWALMSRPGRVFTRAQLIERALGDDFDGFDRTVDTHIWSIRKKLGDNKAAPRYIFSELGVGYRFAGA